MTVRLAIAYSLIAMLIAFAVITIAWLRYNSHAQSERRRRQMEDRALADLHRKLAIQGPRPNTESKIPPEG